MVRLAEVQGILRPLSNGILDYLFYCFVSSHLKSYLATNCLTKRSTSAIELIISMNFQLRSVYPQEMSNIKLPGKKVFGNFDPGMFCLTLICQPLNSQNDLLNSQNFITFLVNSRLLHTSSIQLKYVHLCECVLAAVSNQSTVYYSWYSRKYYFTWYGCDMGVFLITSYYLFVVDLFARSKHLARRRPRAHVFMLQFDRSTLSYHAVF